MTSHQRGWRFHRLIVSAAALLTITWCATAPLAAAEAAPAAEAAAADGPADGSEAEELPLVEVPSPSEALAESEPADAAVAESEADGAEPEEESGEPAKSEETDDTGAEPQESEPTQSETAEAQPPESTSDKVQPAPPSSGEPASEDAPPEEAPPEMDPEEARSQQGESTEPVDPDLMELAPPGYEPAGSEPAEGEPAVAEPAEGSDVEEPVETAPTEAAEADPEAAQDGGATKPLASEEEMAGEEKPLEPVPSESSLTQPEAAEPGLTESAADELPQPAEPAPPQRLRFNFRFQPWEEVLDWFAEQAGLSLVLDAPPSGTFNYTDNRDYTPAEAIDLINSVLLTKGYTLVRRDRMLMLINLDDEVPPNLVSTIAAEELDARGEFELVSVLFDLETITPEDAKTEIEGLVGRQGSIVVLAKSGQILVTETAGRLRTIRRVIQRIEDPKGVTSAKLQTFELRDATADEALVILRSLLDISPEESATSDGSIRLATDAFGTKIYATGKPEMLARVEEILEKIDVPGPYDTEVGGVEQAPQFVVYPVYGADPETVLAVMQTLMAGLPDVRLDKDSKTGNLVALARPNEHATIKATLEQLQAEASQVEVIQLHSVDPEVAVISINKLFGGTAEGGAAGPKVDADPVTRQLLVRGSPSQIEQIRALLEKMGETATNGLAGAQRGNVRMLPLTGRSARTALERLEQLWPTIRGNKIRVVTPSAVIPTLRPGSRDDAAPVTPDMWDLLLQPERAIQPPLEESGDIEPLPRPDDSTAVERAQRFMFVSQPEESSEEAASPSPSNHAPQPELPKGPAPIIVAPGPGGTMIASDDLEALDQFEELLTALANAGASGNTELTIFYLVHSRATIAAQTLDQIFGGGTLAGGSSSRGGSMMGDLANAALGDTAGGLVGSLLGLRGNEGTITPSGSILITPDERLNALIVQATPVDLDTIEQLLEILDQKESPEEILANPKPRPIPLYYTQAEEVAEIVTQVYQNRLVTSGQGQRGGGGGPSPEQIMEFMRRMRGGQGGGRSQQGSEDADKMSIAVDVRTNSLIVAASDALFREVQEFVEMLDQSAIQTGQKVVVVPLKRASPEVIQQALASLAGGTVQVNRSQAGSGQRPGTTSGRPGSPSSTQPRPPGQPGSGYTPDQIDAFRRRMEFFRGMQGGRPSGMQQRGPSGQQPRGLSPARPSSRR